MIAIMIVSMMISELSIIVNDAIVMLNLTTGSTHSLRALHVRAINRG